MAAPVRLALPSAATDPARPTASDQGLTRSHSDGVNFYSVYFDFSLWLSRCWSAVTVLSVFLVGCRRVGVICPICAKQMTLAHFLLTLPASV